MGEAFLQSVDIKEVKHVSNGISKIIEFLRSTEMYESTITVVSSSPFSEKANPTKVIFPACDSIGAYTFSNMYNLQYASFSAAYVGRYAFDYCRNLKTLIFKGGNTCQFSRSLGNSINLDDLYMLVESVPDMGGDPPDFLNSVKRIHVYPSMLNNFVNDEKWSYYSSYMIPYGGEPL